MRYIALITLLIPFVFPAHALAASPLDEAPAITWKKISRGVAGEPGTVAWSPSGERLAYISGRLYISAPDGSGKLKSPLKGVYFVSWAHKDRLLALGVRGKAVYAYLLGPDGKPVSESLLPFAPDAAFQVKGAFETLVLTRDISEDLSIGLRTRSELHVFDVPSGESREVFSMERIHPRALRGKGFVMGWSGAGPSPLDGLIPIIEYYDPPAVNPYVVVSLVDYATGRSRRIFRAPFLRLLDGAGWSAGGSTLAVADTEGVLRLIGRDGAAYVPDEDISGRFAAWGPSGRVICFGGRLMMAPDVDPSFGQMGRSVELPGVSSQAACAMSPSGEMAALTVDGTLYVYFAVTQAGAPFIEEALDEDTPSKVRLLRELLSEGLIKRKEYEMRLERLTGMGAEVGR